MVVCRARDPKCMVRAVDSSTISLNPNSSRAERITFPLYTASRPAVVRLLGPRLPSLVKGRQAQRPFWLRHQLSILAALVAAVLLGAGLFAPCMTLQPSFGGVDALVRLIKPDLVMPTTYSLVGGIGSLLTGGNFLIGGVGLLCSVVLPLWKRGVYWTALARIRRGLPAGAPVRLVHQLG